MIFVEQEYRKEDIQVEEVGSRVKNREKHKKEVRKKTKIIILGIIALVVVIAMLGFILFFKGNNHLIHQIILLVNMLKNHYI